MRLAIFGRRENDESADAPLSVSGDARIDGGAAFPSGLVARSGLTIARGARIVGSLRVMGALTLEEGARVDGDVTVDGDAFVAPGAGVEGRLSCRRLRLGTRPAAGDDEPAATVGDAPLPHAPAA